MYKNEPHKLIDCSTVTTLNKDNSLLLKPLDNIGETEKQKCSQIYT